LSPDGGRIGLEEVLSHAGKQFTADIRRAIIEQLRDEEVGNGSINASANRIAKNPCFFIPSSSYRMARAILVVFLSYYSTYYNILVRQFDCTPCV